MFKLRVITGPLLALLLIAGNWPLPGLSANVRHFGAGGVRSVLASQRSMSHGVRAVSDAAITAAAAPAIVDDAVILLDVTGSMRGEGPDPRARDIWEKTVHAVSDIVDRLAPKTNLALVPFSNGPEWTDVFPGPVTAGGKLTPQKMDGDTDREAVKAHLRKLVADGEATWLYESLEYSLTQLRQWREADSVRTHRQALFLYTDGIDNGPNGQLGIDGIVQLVQSQKADFRGLYFVYNDLAGHLSAEQRAQLAEIGVTVTVGPPTSNVELVTEKLDFGALITGSDGVSQAISFRSGFADVWGRMVRLRIEELGPKLPLVVAAETAPLQEQVAVVLRPTAPLPEGQHLVRLTIEPVDGAFNLIPRNSIDLTFSFAAAPQVEEPPAPAPAAVPMPRTSIVEGIPDLLLFLGMLVPVAAGSVAVMWWRQLWLFKWPGRAAQLTWRRTGEPIGLEEEAMRTRTIRPERSRAAEEWIIGIEGYVSLPDGGAAIRPNHAKIVYGGRKQRDFRLVPVDGAVQVDGREVAASGLALGDGSSFVIGPYQFHFESLNGTDHGAGSA